MVVGAARGLGDPDPDLGPLGPWGLGAFAPREGYKAEEI